MAESQSPEVLRDDALSGRVALVTGAGTGIGQDIAQRYAALGARVWGVGRRSEPLAETAGAFPDNIVTRSVDIRDSEEIADLVAEIVATEGRIDVLVNNAGGQFIAPAADISKKGFKAVTSLNFDATWALSVAVAKSAMIPQGYGKIISITMTPRQGMPGMSHSSAARAAVESLTSTWAQEWGPLGIRTTAIAPGVVHTSAWEQRYQLDPEVIAAVVPLRRLQQTNEVAEIAAFLASAAGDYITGQTLVADGGWGLVGPIAAVQEKLS